jgi:hypothetical protein
VARGLARERAAVGDLPEVRGGEQRRVGQRAAQGRALGERVAEGGVVDGRVERGEEGVVEAPELRGVAAGEGEVAEQGREATRERVGHGVVALRRGGGREHHVGLARARVGAPPREGLVAPREVVGAAGVTRARGGQRRAKVVAAQEDPPQVVHHEERRAVLAEGPERAGPREGGGERVREEVIDGGDPRGGAERVEEGGGHGGQRPGSESSARTFCATGASSCRRLPTYASRDKSSCRTAPPWWRNARARIKR